MYLVKAGAIRSFLIRQVFHLSEESGNGGDEIAVVLDDLQLEGVGETSVYACQSNDEMPAPCRTRRQILHLSCDIK